MIALWNIARALLLVSWVLLLVAGRQVRGWCARPAQGDLAPAAAGQIAAEYARTRPGWAPALPITTVERFG